MTQWIIALAMGLWLGVLTSISPCPMATNITAISFISRKIDAPRYVVLTGLLYTLARAATYVVLAVLIIAGLLNVPVLSNWLQKYMNRLLGPILIIVAMFLLELITIRLPGAGSAKWVQKKAQTGGLSTALLLGVIFAVSFCPVSAAIYFGSLIPLAVKQNSWFGVPMLYGIGTALPVVGFSLIIALGTNKLARTFEKLTAFEKWTRRITASVFMLVGFYYTLAYTIGIFRL